MGFLSKFSKGKNNYDDDDLDLDDDELDIDDDDDLEDDDEDEQVVYAERAFGHVASKVFTTLLFAACNENPHTHCAGHKSPECGEPRCFFHSDNATFARQNQQVEYQETYKDSVKNQPVVESFEQREITFLSKRLDPLTGPQPWPVARRYFEDFHGASSRNSVHS